MAQERGEIGQTFDHARIGAVVFAIFQIEVRKWLAGRPMSLEDGLRHLREALEILVTGLSPVTEALRPPRTTSAPRSRRTSLPVK